MVMVWDEEGNIHLSYLLVFCYFTCSHFLGQISLHFVCEAMKAHCWTPSALRGTSGTDVHVSQESPFAPSQLSRSLFLLSCSGYSLPALSLSDRFPRAAGMS